MSYCCGKCGDCEDEEVFNYPGDTRPKYVEESRHRKPNMFIGEDVDLEPEEYEDV
jgi:hypothetical protein